MNKNENGQQKTIFGIPCQGCTDRASILGAGNWKIDAMILGGVGIIIGLILLTKYSTIGD